MNKNQQQAPIIINELNVRSIDRSRKDIASWRAALVAAEAISFPNRSRLYDLYEDILLDGHLSGVIAKKVNAVLNKGIRFEADGHHVAAMDELIRSLEFRTVVRTVIETLL